MDRLAPLRTVLYRVFFEAPSSRASTPAAGEAEHLGSYPSVDRYEGFRYGEHGLAPGSGFPERIVQSLVIGNWDPVVCVLARTFQNSRAGSGDRTHVAWEARAGPGRK